MDNVHSGVAASLAFAQRFKPMVTVSVDLARNLLRSSVVDLTVHFQASEVDGAGEYSKGRVVQSLATSRKAEVFDGQLL